MLSVRVSLAKLNTSGAVSSIPSNTRQDVICKHSSSSYINVSPSWRGLVGEEFGRTSLVSPIRAFAASIPPFTLSAASDSDASLVEDTVTVPADVAPPRIML